MSEDAYLLRDRDRDEIQRLALQHAVWRDCTTEAIERAGFGAGQRLLDVGCGPGFVAFDLVDRVGSSGSVLGVDASELFVRHLREEAARRELANLEAFVGDVRDLGAEVPEGFDGAFCRWLLMFVPEPERVLAELARVLRPGGVFVAMEYFQFRTMALWPEGAMFRRVFDGVHAQIAAAGGDADIGGSLPRLLTSAGFRIVDVYSILRVGRPGAPLWDWLHATDTHHPQLVEAGLVSEEELTAFREEWSRASASPDAFFAAPPVLVTVARRVSEE